MRIGIDISQIAHEKTGVARYMENLVRAILAQDRKNEYVLFGSSLRRRKIFMEYEKTLPKTKRYIMKLFPFPPKLLHFLWNECHIMPVSWLIGNVDIFWSSDWTQPPIGKAKGITTIHDLSFFSFPESFDKEIIAVQKKRLTRVFRVCKKILCDSEATRKDVIKFFGTPSDRLVVVYPGLSLPLV
jgi:glycosyltransferase involved in cell wall biosynthesis